MPKPAVDSRASKRPPSLKQLEAECDAFNARCAVGSEVVVTKDNGDRVITRTRCVAGIMSGHTAVVWLQGISGAYLLSRVDPDPLEVDVARIVEDCMRLPTAQLKAFRNALGKAFPPKGGCK